MSSRLWFAVEIWPGAFPAWREGRFARWDALGRELGLRIWPLYDYSIQELPAVYETLRRGGRHLTYPGPSIFIERLGWRLDSMPYHPHWIGFYPVSSIDAARLNIETITQLAERHGIPEVSRVGSTRERALRRLRRLGQHYRALFNRIRTYYAPRDSGTLVAWRALGNPEVEIPRLLQFLKRCEEDRAYG